MTGHACRDYFDLQLRFAARYAALAGVPLAEAVGTCTNLRRRFGWWDPPGDDKWAKFLGQLQRCARHEDLLEFALATHDAALPRARSPFGCFSYDPPDARRALRLHFMPDDRHRQASPLAEGSLSERRAELRAMFMEVRRLHAGVRQVRGLSWLYHVRAYQRLFPPAYIASVAPATEPLRMNGSSTWGQVLDYRHQVRPGIAQRVLAGLDASNVRAPWMAFPLQPLAATCPVEHFFDGMA